VSGQLSRPADLPPEKEKDIPNTSAHVFHTHTLAPCIACSGSRSLSIGLFSVCLCSQMVDSKAKLFLRHMQFNSTSAVEAAGVATELNFNLVTHSEPSW
jgi:hypothetical protein